MAYKQHENAALETLIDYSAAVQAALQALDPASSLAEPWQALRAKLKGERDQRDDDRFAVLCASSIVRLRDAEFDKALGDVSGMAFLAAGKQADAEPYASLFGTTKAAEVRALGPDAAVTFAEGLLQKAQAQNTPMLAEPLQKLHHATAHLGPAGHERTAAEQKSAVHEVVRKQALAATEALTATTQATLLAQWPGRDDLVRACLAPQK